MPIWKPSSSDTAYGGRTKDISPQDRERLFFLMHQMLRCGQTTEASVRAISKAFRAEGKNDISASLTMIAQKVAQGKPMSKACESERVIFSDVHRAAILAGEASNNMTDVFRILQELEQKRIEAMRSGMSELITPAGMLLMSMASIFNTGLNTMPVLAEMKKAEGKQLGVIPRSVMGVTSWCAEYWYLILTVVVLSTIIFYSMSKSPQGRILLDKYILKMPIYGQFIAFKTYAGMLLYFPQLIASGAKPKQMIPIMEALATNVILRRRIDLFNQVITTGGQISDAMEKAGFPLIAVTPVRVSENYSGSTAGVNDVMVDGMNHSYTILERDLGDTHKRFIAVFSGILWVLGGLVMLMEMLAIILSQA